MAGLFGAWLTVRCRAPAGAFELADLPRQIIGLGPLGLPGQPTPSATKTPSSNPAPKEMATASRHAEMPGREQCGRRFPGLCGPWAMSRVDASVGMDAGGDSREGLAAGSVTASLYRSPRSRGPIVDRFEHLLERPLMPGSLPGGTAPVSLAS